MLRVTDQPEIAALVRDRLSVISDDGDASSSSTSSSGGSGGDDDDDDDVNMVGSQGADGVRNTKEEKTAAAAGAAAGAAAVGTALRAIAKGTKPVPSTLASGRFWEQLLASTAPKLAHLRARGSEGGGEGGGGGVRVEDATEGAHWPGLDRRAASLRAKLRVDGYLQCPRPACGTRNTHNSRNTHNDANGDAADADDGDDDGTNTGIDDGDDVDPWTRALGDHTTLSDVADAMGALRDAGWPPVAIYAFDAAWVIIDRLFEVAAAVGEGVILTRLVHLQTVRMYIYHTCCCL